MGWFSRKVTVTFVDDATGEVFATSAIPPADLPETFEIETTLHLAGTDWSVVHAEPATRPRYIEVGALTLRLRRVVRVDLSDILYSLPSICDRLAEVGDEPLVGDECVLAEDDWRQLEFVSRMYATETDADLAAVRLIHEQESASVGWRKVHVRRRPDPPITGSLLLADIQQAFAGAAVRGVYYRGTKSPIVAGFSIRAADGVECYGVAEGGRVTVLGVVQDSPVSASTEALARLAKAFDLDLVRWCWCERASWDSPRFRQLLTGIADG